MSRKQSMPISTPVIMVLLGALVLAAVIFGSGNGFNTTSSVDTSARGLTITSVSAPNIISTNSDLSNLNWQVTGLLGGSDNIVFSDDGVTAEKPFTLTATGIRETLTYDIRSEFNPDYNGLVWHDVTGQLPLNQNCPSNTIYDLRFRNLLGFGSHVCVTESLRGWHGDVLNPNKGFDATLTISNGEDTIPVTISEEDPSATFTKGGETLATVRWTGSLVTGNRDPPQPEASILSIDSGSSWLFLQDDTPITSYVASRVGLEQYTSTQLKQLSTQTEYDAEIQRLKNLVAGTNSKFTDVWRSSTNAPSGFRLLNAQDHDRAALEYTNTQNLLVPQLTFNINAEWLGIERSAGMPVIERADSVAFGKDQQGVINVRIRNSGGDGEFALRLLSCSGFSVDGSAPKAQFDAGETRTMSLYIRTSSVNTDLSESCTVEAYDTSLSTNRDTQRVALEFTATNVCTPNQYWVDAEENAVYRCSADGTTASPVLTCNAGTVASFTGAWNNGGYSCKNLEDGTTATPPSQGDGKFSPVLLIVTLVLSTGAGVWAWNSARRLNKWVGIIVGIIAFVAVFLFVPAFVNGIIQMFTLNIPGFSVIP